MKFQAYNEVEIRNLQLQNTAEELFDDDRLTPPQYEQVKEAFPVNLNQPSIFIRIGLFIFTSLCILFALFFWGLMTGGLDHSGTSTWGGLLLFFGIALTGINIMAIQSSKWYRQGSDNALIYASIISFVGGICLMFGVQNQMIVAVLVCLFSTIAAIYYGDPLLTLVAFFSLLFSFFDGFEQSMSSLIFLPFICATISVFTYFLSKTALKNEDWFYWKDCFRVLEIASLATLYLSLNYFVISELMHQNEPSSVDVSEAVGISEEGVSNPSIVEPVKSSIPFVIKAIFVFFTAIIPFLYLAIGIKTRYRILWIMGGACIIASIATYRYYYSMMPIEMGLTCAGIVLLSIAFLLMKYLKTPQKGFANIPKQSKYSAFEALVVNQILQQSPSGHVSVGGDTPPQYGGGDFDGGGAGGDFE